MAYLNGVVRFKPSDRLFEPLRSLLTMTACISVSALSFMENAPSPRALTGVGIINSRRLQRNITVPTRGVMECATHNLKPTRIDLSFTPTASSEAPPGYGKAGDIYSELFDTAAALTFGNFYEAHRVWIQSKDGFGQEVATWPTVLNFARVIRNFISHAGRVYFSKLNAPPLSWHAFTYSPADQGRRVIGTEFKYAELLILMVEISDELDRAGAPVAN